VYVGIKDYQSRSNVGATADEQIAGLQKDIVDAINTGFDSKRRVVGAIPSLVVRPAWDNT
jgi:hypothetical protein